jgi:hypothetical protein
MEQQVKVSYPGQYNAKAGVKGDVFTYLTNNTLAEALNQVNIGLVYSHETLEKHAVLNGASFNVIDNSERSAPMRVQVDIAVPQDDVPSVLGDQLNLKAIVEIWAQRCRVTGVRGDRFYAIELPDPNQFHSFTLLDANGLPVLTQHHDGTTILDFDEDIVLRTNLLIGTTVFYNERQVTIGFPGTDEQAVADMENLVYHLTKEAPSVGVIVTYDDLGTFCYGA